MSGDGCGERTYLGDASAGEQRPRRVGHVIALREGEVDTHWEREVGVLGKGFEPVGGVGLQRAYLICV